MAEHVPSVGIVGVELDGLGVSAERRFGVVQEGERADMTGRGRGFPERHFPLGTPPRELAAAPATLAGLKIAVLDNGKPHADVLMERIARQLADRSGASFIGTRRKGSAATPCCPSSHAVRLAP